MKENFIRIRPSRLSLQSFRSLSTTEKEKRQVRTWYLNTVLPAERREPANGLKEREKEKKKIGKRAVAKIEAKVKLIVAVRAEWSKVERIIKLR